MPNELIAPVLEKLKRMLADATPGPVTVGHGTSEYDWMEGLLIPLPPGECVTKSGKRVLAQFNQNFAHEADEEFYAALRNHADALLNAAEERDRQAPDIRRLQELAEHLELENSRLQEKLQEARDLNKGQQDARILEDENRVLAEKTSALQAEIAALRKVAEAAKSLSSLANEPGYMGGVEGWECAECAPMDRSGKRLTQADVVHEPECFQGAASTLRAALKELEEERRG